MKKYIFLISILTTFLNADSIHRGMCVKNFFVDYNTSTRNATMIINYRDGSSYNIPFDIETINSLVLNDGKYQYSSTGFYTQRCTSKSNNNPLNISDETFQLLSGLTGLLTGFLLSFIILKRI